ncbi:hypothetical protein H1R82_00430 [Thermoactinomyces intermedius]|jgi:hypothetical protein|uniref:Zinc ribbon domain-containing protein n=1 Tax=Thermoactinomyces intermedius TaxID=2024 RepID=A0A8I1AAV1_THEIN|nr:MULTISPECIES: hypothetical protein [Thermoactinomyces]MBA4549646.1 hypothetical protein [Thermoactinomyces intermedius]MBA4835112.1 hypothetical protein [Thermoactinomyces intermedius]MBH8595881.1 hypothetical protein [Thermoactinomyces intermedius]MBH8600861.1 hypothetical protein [Thermoactinomyces sp. CICC 23799]
MRDYLPDPLPVSHRLQCRECREQFKTLHSGPLEEKMVCPSCGWSGTLSEWMTEEAVLRELALARKKLEKVFFKMKSSHKS